MTNLSSFLILLLLLYGRSLWNKNLIRHIQLVTLAMVLDVGLILYLTFAHDALSKVNLSMGRLLAIHVCLALTTVVVYGLISHAGWRLYKGNGNYRKRLRRLDRILIPLRVLVLVTSLLFTYIDLLDTF
jgi:hypothetical protein